MTADGARFHIHGDNIVECERTLQLILRSLGDAVQAVDGPSGSVACPSFTIRTPDATLHFRFFPGFGRWRQDLLSLVRARGGPLREAADAIVTRVTEAREDPIVAIEYCGALPAGNQAWQRNGRAYSLSCAEIPYLYIAEIGGFELGGDRRRKAARLPNPAVPFSYVVLSEAAAAPALPVFIQNPGADPEARAYYGPVFGDQELSSLIQALILGRDADAFYEQLKEKTIRLVGLLAGARRSSDSFPAEEWRKAYSAIAKGKSLVSFVLSSIPQRWSKTAYIKSLTKSAKQLIAEAPKFAIGLTSSNLPVCLVPRDRRRAFADLVRQSFPRDLPADFSEWLTRDQDLVIAWVMGFKPRGDDARPDRGLPPLARMLIGPSVDLLSVVYGPAPPGTWGVLENDPVTLAQRNGLWESIMAVSDALLVHSSTDAGKTRGGYIRSHWASRDSARSSGEILVEPRPRTLGEHDVDTAIHLISVWTGAAEIFEGMCNPPGGDWSGVSMLTPDQRHELRWLSLPRVSRKGSKRPDHVLQIFGVAPKPIALSIESKESPNAVEREIGPRLNLYLAGLLDSPATIERAGPAQAWSQSKANLKPDALTFASAAACLGSAEDIGQVAVKADCDLVLGFAFEEQGSRCTLRILPCTPLGRKIAAFLDTLPTERIGILVSVL